LFLETADAKVIARGRPLCCFAVMTDVVDDLALEEARRIVLGKLRGTSARVYLFGSRAQGNARRNSDIDIGILLDPVVPPEILAEIRDALTESTIPYRVDVVDLGQVDAPFRRRVVAEGTPWNG